MTKEIVVQGEFHTNPNDARKLIEDAPTAEILYIEGRSDTISLIPKTFRYTLFLIGYLQLELLYASNTWLREKIGRGFDIEQEARDAGLDVFSEIDLELHEAYSESDSSFRRVVYGVSMLLLAAGILYPIWQESIVAGTPELSGVILVAVAPAVYFFGIVGVILPRENIRDEVLAQSVVKHADREGYQNMLLLVGDAHVPGVAGHLENSGYNVDANRSQHPQMRLKRAVASILGRIRSTFFRN